MRFAAGPLAALCALASFDALAASGYGDVLVLGFLAIGIGLVPWIIPVARSIMLRRS